jgi:hypothetical protein
MKQSLTKVIMLIIHIFYFPCAQVEIKFIRLIASNDTIEEIMHYDF